MVCRECKYFIDPQVCISRLSFSHTQTPRRNPQFPVHFLGRSTRNSVLTSPNVTYFGRHSQNTLISLKPLILTIIIDSLEVLIFSYTITSRKHLTAVVVPVIFWVAYLDWFHGAKLLNVLMNCTLILVVEVTFVTHFENPGLRTGLDSSPLALYGGAHRLQLTWSLPSWLDLSCNQLWTARWIWYTTVYLNACIKPYPMSTAENQNCLDHVIPSEERTSTSIV